MVSPCVPCKLGVTAVRVARKLALFHLIVGDPVLATEQRELLLPLLLFNVQHIVLIVNAVQCRVLQMRWKQRWLGRDPDACYCNGAWLPVWPCIATNDLTGAHTAADKLAHVPSKL